MDFIDKHKGEWRAQLRRGGQTLINMFRMKADAEAWRGIWDARSTAQLRP